MDITSYIMGSIAGAKSASGLKYLVVDELPEIGADNTIYLVSKSTSKTNNYYDEYMYISNAWELIGDTEIDLSNYQTLLSTTNKLNADYIDDSESTNKLTNATEKATWNGKQDVIQYSAMPTASATNVGKIVQFTGTTDSNYTNGYFYQVVSDGQDPATYSWENIQVQDGGGSSAPAYIEDGNGARMYIVKYTTDSTYNDNIMKPILQAMLDDYRNNNNNSNWSIYIDDRRSINTYDHYTTTNYTGIYKIGNLFSTSVQFYNITPTLIKNISTYYGQTGITKRNITLNAIMSNYVISNFNFNATTTGLGSFIGIGDNYSTPFNPTQPYHPANKKYVDDSIASAIGTALQGNY